jgi:hypothetical protein
MGISEIVGLLIAERDRIERAIQALGAPAKRRGRPPRTVAHTAVAVASPAPAKQPGPHPPSNPENGRGSRQRHAKLTPNG